MIEEVRLDRLRLPLKQPYKLTFGPVTDFDTIIACVVAGGRQGLGEATILTGYTEETIEAGWARAKALAPHLPGLSTEVAKDIARRELSDAPFTLTAFVSAMEMAEAHPMLNVETPCAVPLLAGINATDPLDVEREIEAAIGAGYDTLKIKVGFDLESDLKRVAFIQRCNAGRAQLRIDGNQGYSSDDGVSFAASVSPESVELLEQPCHASDWEAAAAITAVNNVPIMLDESIYGFDDIRRAARIGARFVKLKLMKMGGLTRLAEGLRLIRDLGMEPVLGNGVASDLGCWMEACVARHYVTNAGEMNGFLRQRQSLAMLHMPVAGGRIFLSPGRIFALDEARMVAASEDQVRALVPDRSRLMAS